MSNLIPNLRVGARSLLRQPGLAIVSVLTLALAIGANVAIFSVIDAVLLRPAPFRAPGRVVVSWEWKPAAAKRLGSDDLPESVANFYDFQRSARSFEALALVQQSRQALTGQGEPEQLGTVLVTSDFFKVLGTSALIGRTLRSDDEVPGAPLATVLSYDFWQRRFAGSPAVVGRKLTMNGKPLTVVGVMPPRFAFPLASEVPSYLGFSATPDAWLPSAFSMDERQDRGNRVSFMLGRLKPGVSRRAAEQELNAILHRLSETYPVVDSGWTIHLTPIVEQMTRGLRPVLVVLWAAVAMVLLIACVNVANLLLARSASRQKEIALRTALGAGRARLVGQVLAESALLSLGGGVLGAFLAWAFLRLCAAAIPAGLAGAATFELDWRALAFTLLLCALTTLLSGMVPALQTTRPNLADSLREGSRMGSGAVRSRQTRSVLVVVEVAIAVSVLTGAGLLLRSFARLMDVDPGFQAAHVLTFKLNLPADRPADQLASFYARLDRELHSLPGATGAAIISELPMGGIDNVTAVVLEGRPPEPGKPLLVGARTATPDYFTTLHIPLRKGRLLSDGDTRDRALSAVVDEAMAEAYWPGEEVLGKRFKRRDGEDSWVTVVGVVGSLRHSDLYSEPRPTFYMTPDQVTRFYMPNEVSAVVRTPGDPESLVPAVRRAVSAVDRNQPVSQIRSLSQVVAGSIIRNRLSLLLLAILAALALGLALIGIYGVTSYAVAQRTPEIGLRLALGARRGQVLLSVVRQAGLLTILGVACGTLAAFVLTRLAGAYLTALLFKVRSTDPPTFVAVAALLALVAVGAAYVAARRATRVSPVVALRMS